MRVLLLDRFYNLLPSSIICIKLCTYHCIPGNSISKYHIWELFICFIDFATLGIHNDQSIPNNDIVLETWLLGKVILAPSLDAEKPAPEFAEIEKVYILIRLNFYNFHNHFASKQSWFISRGRRPHSIKQTIKNFPCIHSFTTFPVHINNCTTKIDIAFNIRNERIGKNWIMIELI